MYIPEDQPNKRHLHLVEPEPEIIDVPNSEIRDELLIPETDGEEHNSSRNQWLKRAFGVVALSATTFIGGGIAGSMATPAHTKLGPHNADMRLTLDSRRTVDFGLPGSLSWQQEFGGRSLGVGVRFDIKGIPLDDSVHQSESGFSEEDIRRYESFFSDPEKDRERIANDFKRHFASWGLGSMVAINATVLAGYLGSRYALDKNLRRKISESIHTKRRGLYAVAATTALGVVAAGVGTTVHQSSSTDKGTVGISSEFDDTPLEGARIRGKLLATGINKYGVDAMQFLERNEQFYDNVNQNLTSAFQEAPAILHSDQYGQTFIFETGLHCNMGMMQVLGRASKLFKPDFILDGGDITFSGSALESTCLETLRYHTGKLPLVTAPGNHDSEETMRQARKNRFRVLDGNVIEINGIRILGDSDPRYSAFGQAVAPRPDRNESVSQMGERLASQTMIDPTGVDILLVNEPGAAYQSVTTGGAKLALSGGFKRAVRHFDNKFNYPSVSYTGASTGGSSSQRLTIGPLEDTSAEFTILKYDSFNHRPVAFQVVIVNPDTTVEISEPENLILP